MRGLVLLLVGVGACASGPRPFALRDPMWRDTDLDPRPAACRPDPEKPGHQLCRPGEYVSSFAWDGADNIIFRPLTEFFAVDPAGEAVNVNSLDEVPDSSWFTNRIGRAPMSVEEMKQGSCAPEDVLDPDAPDGTWLIDSGKPNGANPGFRIRLPDGRKYMLKSDLPIQPERTTGAAAIAGRLYHAAGWFVSCDTPVYLKPSILKLKPGLKVTDNQGMSRPFDQAALDALLARASKRGDRVRFMASRWLPGRTIGPFTYAGTKSDDPADVIRHEDRRDLRGARLLAAWTSHFDSREQNSMSTWLSADPKDPDASPGHVRHYYIDLGDCFGSAWTDEIWRRIGHAYYFDIGYLVADFLTLGIITRPWDRARREPDSIFGYYTARDFDPEKWRGGYPNPAFDNMSEHDGAWAARIIARFTDEHLRAAVDVGDFTDPAQSAYLVEQLIGRRDLILRRYFALLSPVTDLAVDGGKLCGVDLARRTRVFPAELFHYRARVAGGAALPVEARDDGVVCVSLPRASGYLVVELENGQAQRPLRAHLYDQGPSGHRLVGIER